MASEHKANRRRSFVIMSSVSVVVFLSLVFTLMPLNQAFAGPPPSTLPTNGDASELQIYYKFNSLLQKNENFTVMGSFGDVTSEVGVIEGTGLFGETNGAHRYTGVTGGETVGGLSFPLSQYQLAWVNSEFPYDNNGWTVNVWGKGTTVCSNLGAFCSIIDTGDGGTIAPPGIDGFYLAFANFGGQASIDTSSENGGPGFDTDDSWHMYTFTFNDTANLLTYYKDGVSSATDALSGNDGKGHPQVNNFVIGKAKSFTDGEMRNLIDELSGWSTVLNQTQIDELYNSGIGINITGTAPTCPNANCPDYPTGQSVTQNLAPYAELEWDAAFDAVSYNIYWRENGNDLTWDKVGSTTKTYFTDKKLPYYKDSGGRTESTFNNVIDRYKIGAVNSTGDINNSTELVQGLTRPTSSTEIRPIAGVNFIQYVNTDWIVDSTWSTSQKGPGAEAVHVYTISGPAGSNANVTDIHITNDTVSNVGTFTTNGNDVFGQKITVPDMNLTKIIQKFDFNAVLPTSGNVTAFVWNSTDGFIAVTNDTYHYDLARSGILDVTACSVSDCDSEADQTFLFRTQVPLSAGEYVFGIRHEDVTSAGTHGQGVISTDVDSGVRVSDTNWKDGVSFVEDTGNDSNIRIIGVADGWFFCNTRDISGTITSLDGSVCGFNLGDEVWVQAFATKTEFTSTGFSQDTTGIYNIQRQNQPNMRSAIVPIEFLTMPPDVLATQTRGNFSAISGGSGSLPILCNGLTPTIIGTTGNDFINGTSGDDVIVALEGDDIILGNGGNDTICAGAGQDYVTGNAGADTIFGEGGQDLLNGRGGNDTIDGGAGDDVIVGRAGNDILMGGGGNDHISGQNGNDTIEGNGGADHISGGDGNDNIRGNGGDDVVSGGNGDDDLDGDAGFDYCIDTVGTNTFTQCEITS